MYFILLLTLLTGTAQCANILGIFMYPSINHQVVFQQIWKELSLRGHQVTVITPDPLNDPKLKNLKEISVRFSYDILDKDTQELFSKDNIQSIERFYKVLDTIAEKQLNSSQFKDIIWDHSKHYDLILIEHLHPVMYAFSHRFNAPVIAISSGGVYSVNYDCVGNPNHPALYPDPNFDFTPGRLTLAQKAQSIGNFLWHKFYYHNVFVPRAHEMAKKHFGDDIPYVGDIERNVSMFFINRNLVVHTPRPNVPAIVEISPLDVTPPKALPKNLQEILDEAREGVIFVNLGRLVEKKLKHLLAALSELPYKVLWQWDLDHLAGKPANVMISTKFPRKDILAHPNVKAFITEGNFQSIESGIASEVPMLCVPVMHNQYADVQRVAKLKVGERFNFDTFTKTDFKNVIVKVAETKSYRKKLKKARAILFDRPMTGLNTAVWWSEYVIRHKGARHLRSPAIDMPWYQYLLLDVILFLISCLVFAIYALYKINTAIPRLIRRMFRKTQDPKVKTS